VRVVVCTIVHHPSDARIYHRQIRALLEAGHQVTYIAPVVAEKFSAERTGPEAQVIGVPRAVGRNRLGALRAARRELARQADSADLLLIHDPELLLALPPTLILLLLPALILVPVGVLRAIWHMTSPG